MILKLTGKNGIQEFEPTEDTIIDVTSSSKGILVFTRKDLNLGHILVEIDGVPANQVLLEEVFAVLQPYFIDSSGNIYKKFLAQLDNIKNDMKKNN